MNSIVLKKSRNFVMVAACAMGATLAGCNGTVNLGKYTEEAVKLKPAGTDTYLGTLDFTTTTYFTNYRTQCDTQICGYFNQNVCNNVTNCNNQYSTPIPAKVADKGRGGDDHRGDDHRGDDHRGGGVNVPPSPVCYTHQECHVESVPQYCQVNCQQIPFVDDNVAHTGSPVVVKIVGAADLSKRIKSLELGFKTNAGFQTALLNPNSLPKNQRGLFVDLDKADKTLLTMRAKGLRLVRAENFLTLPQDFKAGDSVTITVSVQEDGGTTDTLSVIGTQTDIPVLNTDVHTESN